MRKSNELEMLSRFWIWTAWAMVVLFIVTGTLSQCGTGTSRSGKDMSTALELEGDKAQMWYRTETKSVWFSVRRVPCDREAQIPMGCREMQSATKTWVSSEEWKHKCRVIHIKKRGRKWVSGPSSSNDHWDVLHCESPRGIQSVHLLLPCFLVHMTKSVNTTRGRLSIWLLSNRQDVRNILLTHALAFHFWKGVATISLLQTPRKEHERIKMC